MASHCDQSSGPGATRHVEIRWFDADDRRPRWDRAAGDDGLRAARPPRVAAARPAERDGGVPAPDRPYCRFAPVVTRANRAPAPPRPAGPRLLEAAAKVGAVADFLVVTSNATHLFQPDIEEASGREVLGIVELVVGEVGRRGWERVGVVGFGDPVVYSLPLGELGYAVETPPTDLQAPLDQAILRVMEGRVDEADQQAAHDAIAALRERARAGIVVGATD